MTIPDPHSLLRILKKTADLKIELTVKANEVLEEIRRLKDLSALPRSRGK